MKERTKQVKENLKRVAIGTGALIGTTLLIVMGVKNSKLFKDAGVKITQGLEDNEVNHIIHLEPITIKDLGNVGNVIMEKIPKSTEETSVKFIAYINEEDLTV